MSSSPQYSVSSEKRLRPKGAERLKKLKDSATNLFLEHGYEATSMDMVIQKVGGSRRNIYERFGGKEGLFVAVITDECRKLAKPLEGLVLEPFWKFAVIGFQEVLRVIQRQDVDASTTRPHGRNYTQDETLSV